MEFPHINDDKFPHLNTVDVWKYQNDFDYARWTGKVTIKLLNVKWNGSYNDVPGFETDVERDKWFDSQRGLTKVLESAFNITPENSVRLPIPYNDAYTYNYLIVDMPIQTSAEQPIDYEDGKTRVNRWYYFVDSMTQYAPNTTELFVTLDAWTTFMHTVDIPYLMLERGHAPMVQTDVDDFLANPIENNEYLLADDFNYGTNRVISNSSYLPVGNGRKYVLFAVPISQADLLLMGGADYSGNSTPPTFSDTSERWGNQIVVNGYEWKYGANYSDAKMPINSFINQDSVFNGNLVFATASENASVFFNVLASNCVHLLHAIQGVFVVAEDMITLGASFTFKGTVLYPVVKQYATYDLSLNKAAFGFDEHYSEIAKLYTYPYSVLEITDDNGFVSEVRIENTGNVQFHKEISIAFPFVRYQCFFSGMNGNGTLSYTWKNLANADVQKTMWEDDFSKFMMNWDIPTFAVFATQEQEYAVNNYAGMQARRQGAIIDYENAVRFYNTTCENTFDSMATATANVGRLAQTMIDNNLTNCANNEDIVQNVQAPKNRDARDAQNDKIDSDKGVASAITVSTASAQNDLAAITLSHSLGAQLNGYVVGSIGSVVSLGTSDGNLPVAGLISNAVSGGQMVAQQQAASANTMASIATNSAVAQMISDANDAYAANATACNVAMTDVANAIAWGTTTRNNECSKTQTNRNASTNNTNAAATQSTTDNNADWTRDAGVVASQHNLEQVQREAAAQYANNRLGNLVMETAYDGDAYPDVFERRGVRMNLRTQTKAAIAQAGDAFLRFGYALHRVWDMSNGFHYGKHFTFWKAEDVWINDGTGLAGNAVETIRQILLKGTTVWKDPDEIGTLSIYDNI